MGRHGGGAPSFGQGIAQIRHGCVRVAIEHVQDGNRRDNAVIITAANGRVEKVMAAFFKTDQRAQFVRAAFDVRVTGFPIICFGAIGDQDRVGQEQAGGFDIDNKLGIGMLGAEVPGDHHAHFVRKDFFALIVDHAAAIPITVKGEPHIGLGAQHRVTNVMEHFHIFRVRIVVGERMVQFAMKRHNLHAQCFQDLGGIGAGRAIATGHHGFDLAFEFCPVRQIRDIAVAHVGDEVIIAAIAGLSLTIQNDVFEHGHFVRAKGEGALGAHLDAGPAVFIVAGGDHGHARHIQRELGKIRHGRQGQANVLHFAACRHQADNERLFEAGAVGAEVVTHGDGWLHTQFVDHCAQTQPQGLRAHEVIFIWKQPTGVIFPKACGLDEGRGFKFQRVGFEIRARFGQHENYVLIYCLNVCLKWLA